MPRTKKPAGTAVDKRNGRQVELAVALSDALERFNPPDGICSEAAAAWGAYWSGAPARIQTPADRDVLLRWVDALDRYWRLIAEADERPTVLGSTGQDVVNPLYKIAEQALGTVERCERQLGVGARNRADLGIAVISERRSLADMNSRYGGGDGDSDAPAVEEDPRLAVVKGDLA